MSLSPVDDKLENSLQDYMQGWESLGSLISRGKSFSGWERNCCFLNTRDGRFATVSATTGLDLPADSRALCAVDWDRDGDLDVWLANRTAPRLRLLRNEWPETGNFLAIRLEGRTCNRDAVGARVEVHYPADSNRQVQIKTVRAGEGFLSQSTKWLHFGLGITKQVEKIVVRWPDATVQSFDELPTNGWYKIRQHEPAAHSWKPLRPAQPLATASPPEEKTDSHARIFLTVPQPLRELRFVAADGSPASLDDGGSTFVHFWASWCEPCLKELQELSTRQDEFARSGARFLVLSVDTIPDDTPAVREAAANALAKIGGEFESGFATPELLKELKGTWHKSIYPERDMPLPCTFLVQDGKLRAIYSGPMNLDAALSDLAVDTSDMAALQSAAFPFPGRSLQGQFRFDPIAKAEAHFRAGYYGDAVRELANYVEQIDKPNGEDPAQAAAREQALAQAYFMWGVVERERNEWGFAKAAFEKHLAILPHDVQGNLALGHALWKQGEHEVAAARIEAVNEQGRESPQTALAVAKLWLELNEVERSIRACEEAGQRFPDNTAIQFLHAVALEKSGRYREAVELYRSLLKDSFQPDVANNLAWVYATCPADSERNGRLAAQLAQRVCQQTRHRSPAALDTLAAAYAEVGEFSKARQTAALAKGLAFGMGERELASELEQRIAMYEKNAPFRDVPK